MKDTQLPVRKAFYDLLNGQLTIDGTVIPVNDGKLKSTQSSDYYVILAEQTDAQAYTKTGFDSDCTILLDIVTKTMDSVSKDICDTIANQIFTLLTSTPYTHNLTTPSGWQFLNLVKTDDRHLTLQLTSTSSIVRRLIRFSLRAVQS